ncbi:MAG: ABC transporter substrate-binding protein [Nocardioidaceae bacterium]
MQAPSRRELLKGAAGGAAGAFFVSACGAERQGSRDGAPTPTDAVSVEDQRGTTVTLDRTADRIVTIPKPAAAMLIAVDKGPSHLVGMHKASWAAIRDGTLGEFFPQAKKIPHDIAGQNFTPNVESVVALNPDVVVQWADNGTGIIAPLENAGLKVVGLRYGTQEDVDTWIDLFGTLLGKNERARAINMRTARRLEEMKKAASGVSGSPPKVIYFLSFKEGMKAAGKGSYNDFYIRMVGAENVAQEVTGLASVNVEQVLAWDPDIILLGKNDASVPEDVYQDKVWADVSAVRTGRVYRVPLGGYAWDPPSQESPLMWRWLFMLAHPHHKPFDLREQVNEDYEFLYGQQPSAHQLDTILRLDVNDQSANYEQFQA